jgi:hypothetical protein
VHLRRRRHLHVRHGSQSRLDLHDMHRLSRRSADRSMHPEQRGVHGGRGALHVWHHHLHLPRGSWDGDGKHVGVRDVPDRPADRYVHDGRTGLQLRDDDVRLSRRHGWNGRQLGVLHAAAPLSHDATDRRRDVHGRHGGQRRLRVWDDDLSLPGGVRRR